MRGVAYDEGTGVFSWTNAPDNGADYPATFACSADAAPEETRVAADSDTTCTLAAPATAGGARLTVTVNGTSYDYRN